MAGVHFIIISMDSISQNVDVAFSLNLSELFLNLLFFYEIYCYFSTTFQMHSHNHIGTYNIWIFFFIKFKKTSNLNKIHLREDFDVCNFMLRALRDLETWVNVGKIL